MRGFGLCEAFYRASLTSPFGVKTANVSQSNLEPSLELRK